METMIERGRREKFADRPDIAGTLVRIVADTYALSFQTQSFHWNVRGQHFASLHKLFERQYEELAEAVDELAERVRALGGNAPTSLREILNFTSLPTDDGVPLAQGMVDLLLRAHEHLSSTSRRAAKLAEESGDPVTHDMLIGRAGAHDKAAWMLRSTLED